MISCVLVCRVNKDEKHKDKVIFIDAEQDVTRKNSQSYLDDSQINKILNAYNDFEDIEGFAKVVTNKDILKSDSVLSISYYVEGIEEPEVDFEESYTSWQESSMLFNKEIYSLSKLINNDAKNL